MWILWYLLSGLISIIFPTAGQCQYIDIIVFCWTDANNIGILLISGPSVETFQTVSAAAAARNRGIIMVAMGIGPNVNQQELRVSWFY